jgi:hypothetical protein
MYCENFFPSIRTILVSIFFAYFGLIVYTIDTSKVTIENMFEKNKRK